MPRGAIADPVERITPRQRLRALSELGSKAALWAAWDHRWVLGALVGSLVVVPRFILGPLASITGLSALLWTVLGFVVVVLATPLGRELVAKGERRRAKRRIWGDWIDFCEDADCAQGPSGNRRAPYLLRRPKVRGSQLSLDIQRIQNTQEERLEDLAEQLERFFRAAGHSIEPRPGRVPDAYRIAIDMPARRSTFRSRRAAPEFDTDPSMADWSQLDV